MRSKARSWTREPRPASNANYLVLLNRKAVASFEAGAQGIADDLEAALE